MYRAETDGIEVQVEPFYLEDQSDASEGQFVWAYRVTIVNNSTLVTRLISRYWNITDANGRVEEVAGDGVVGEQPELRPGDSYQYTSGCPLPTSSGFMVGHYMMEDVSGRRFNVAIPAFSLDVPDRVRTIN